MYMNCVPTIQILGNRLVFTRETRRGEAQIHVYELGTTLHIRENRLETRLGEAQIHEYELHTTVHTGKQTSLETRHGEAQIHVYELHTTLHIRGNRLV